MSWVGGVDLVGMTEGAEQPNYIIHVASWVTTPLGSGPAGMILIQPDPSGPPELMGFISSNPETGAYFGPKIFAGTPFENAPVLEADISVDSTPDSVTSRIKIGDQEIVCVLSKLGELEKIEREPGAMTPFSQQGLEAPAGEAKLTINGKEVPVTVPPIGITGGPGAVSTPAGIYAR